MFVGHSPGLAILARVLTLTNLSAPEGIIGSPGLFTLFTVLYTVKIFTILYTWRFTMNKNTLVFRMIQFYLQ